MIVRLSAVSLLAAALLTGCGTAPKPADPPPAVPSAAPVPAAPAAPSAEDAACNDYSDLVASKCGWNRDDAQAQCLMFNRLGDLAGCPDTIRAALVCTQTDLGARTAPVTCPTKACDPLDIALEGCLTTYCARQPTNPDCLALKN